jgi:hypothetical protein
LSAGKFRHLPVVENGEVVALLDITKCLYDAIARMERAAEKGNAIAAAVEGIERQWGNGQGGEYFMLFSLFSFTFQDSSIGKRPCDRALQVLPILTAIWS